MVDRPLRVLSLIGYLSDQGGAERFVLGLVTHLPSDRFELWLCAPRGAEPAPAEALAQARVRLVDLGRRGRWDVYRWWGLIRLLRRERFDILHAHMFGSNLWGTIIGRLLGVPVVLAHEQTWSYRGNPLRAWLDGHVIGRLATRFIAVSPADAERMVRVEHVPPEKVLLMPNAYVPRKNGRDTDIRHELSIPSGTPLIFTAVVLRPQKALEVMLDAVVKVRQTLPDVQLVIAGDGPLRGHLEQAAADRQLVGTVHFLGARADVEAILAGADIAALSSDFEGMPLFALECMAGGVPMVTTAVGALPDLIENGRSGSLVPPRDSAAMAEAMIDLLRQPELRSQMASSARERMTPYGIDQVAARFASLYERLAAEATR